VNQNSALVCLTNRSEIAARLAMRLICNCIAILTIGLLCGCDAPVKSSVEKFADSYERAFNSGDTNSLIALTKWDGVPDEIRRGMIWTLTNDFTKHKITETVLTPFESNPSLPTWHLDGRKLESNLQPKYWLEVTTELRAPVTSQPETPVKTVSRFLLGGEGEKYWFCGFTFAQH
jgi:hypothetical protein